MSAAGLPRVAEQQRCRADTADQLVRVSVGERSQPGGVVGEYVGRHAAQADNTDDHLGPAGD